MRAARIGRGSAIGPDVRLRSPAGDGDPPVIGADAVIRSGTVLYPDVVVGDRFVTGHHALVREETTIGDDVLVGTQTVIDGASEIGSRVRLQTGVYVPRETMIGDRVFVGPHAVMTNDPYPLRRETPLAGPHVADDVSIGANATILPDLTIGSGAFVAAGAVVTSDVPPDTLAVGVPAQHHPLPSDLAPPNEP